MGSSVSDRAIRCATWGDAEQIAVLLDRYGEQEEPGALPHNLPRVREQMECGEFLVLEQPGHPGFAAAIHVSISGQRGRLSQLAVEPELDREQVGRRLVTVAELLCQARGCETVELVFDRSTAQVPLLYRQLGYRQSGAGAAVAPLTGAVVMSKELEPVHSLPQ